MPNSILRFVKRGGSPAVTIQESSLSAHAPADQLPPAVALTYKQEVELPRTLNVTYVNEGAQYQGGVQRSIHQITDSVDEKTVHLAIAMADADAKKIADVLDYVAWTERTGAQIIAKRRYSANEPTDLIAVARKDGTTDIFLITKKDENGKGLVTFDVVADDPSIYTQSAAAASASGQSATVALPGPTELQLMDIPILRDQDDGCGFYAASCGYLPDWSGAPLYKSVDGGVTFAEATSLTTAATIGTTTTALGEWTGGNNFDETNTVVVHLVSGTLSSDTSDNVLNGANALLIGSEVLQFKSAVLTAANTYTLSGLLRGRLGTDWAMGLHTTGERVVLLTTTGVRRVVEATTEIGLARTYKAPAFGMDLSGASSQAFTDTGVGLKPYSPVLVGGGRDSAGNITLKCVRRTRIDGEWRDYVDASLGEATEAYEWDIMNGSTVVRTLSSSTPTVSYSSSEQTTDFGAPQPSVTINVYQISATIGRGYAAAATI